MCFPESSSEMANLFFRATNRDSSSRTILQRRMGVDAIDYSLVSLAASLRPEQHVFPLK
jgi:hypothetical protein